jgi:hypothetical protein
MFSWWGDNASVAESVGQVYRYITTPMDFIVSSVSEILCKVQQCIEILTQL